MKKRRFFIIAAEASADMVGSYILSGLKKLYGEDIEIKGIGGPLMEAIGNFKSLIPLSFLSQIGFLYILKKLPFFYRVIHSTVKAIDKFMPDALITIDAPELCFRISARIKKEIFRIHCIPPTVWAWRSGRAKTISQYTDHLLSLFPFESPYFKNSGIGCTFVGHPVTQISKGNPENFFARYPFLKKNPVLCLLPGSRNSEITTLLPIFLKVFHQLKTRIPNLQAILVTPPFWKEKIRTMNIEKQIPIITTEQEKYDAFAASSLALAASGSVSLELAIHKTSMVIAYKVDVLTAFILKRLLTTDKVALINHVAGKKIVPEYLQHECCPDLLANALFTLLKEKSKREQQQADLQKAVHTLYTDSPFPITCATSIDNLLRAKNRI